MIKVLIVDGEPENIKNFKAYIRNNFTGFNVVGTTGSAGDFIKTVRSLAPQLILADIRVLGHLTIRLISEVNDLYPDTRFIVYGNYSDTAYMEKTMEHGVIDFLYHPVKPSELDRRLRRAAAVFEDMKQSKLAKEQLVEDYRQNIDFYKDRFIQNLLQGHLLDDFEIRGSFTYFNLVLPPAYTVFTLRVDHFKKVILVMDEMEKHVLSYQILSITNDKVKNFCALAIINRLNSISVILGGSVGLADTIELCEEIRMEVLARTRLSVTIGVGRSYEKPSEIAISANEADAALRYRHIMGYNTVIPIHFVEPLNYITYKYPHEKEEMLVYAAVTGEYNNCDALLRQIIGALKNSGDMPERLVAKIIMSILISISRLASEQHIDIESSFKTFFPFNRIYELKTLDEAYSFLSDSLKSFCQYMLLRRAEHKQKVFERAKDYISREYFKNISIAKIAMHAETTPEFLNSLFMETEKKSVYEYAISARIAKAKELLRDTALEDDIIAVNVGYDDVKHFRSVFRQHERISTNDYRNKMKEEGYDHT